MHAETCRLSHIHHIRSPSCCTVQLCFSFQSKCSQRVQAEHLIAVTADSCCTSKKSGLLKNLLTVSWVCSIMQLEQFPIILPHACHSCGSRAWRRRLAVMAGTVSPYEPKRCKQRKAGLEVLCFFDHLIQNLIRSRANGSPGSPSPEDSLKIIGRGLFSIWDGLWIPDRYCSTV